MLTVLKGSHYFADAFIGEYTVRRSSQAQPARTCPPHHAGVAELVDAPDSKSGFLTEVRVRFPLPAPLIPTARAVLAFPVVSRNCAIGFRAASAQRL